MRKNNVMLSKKNTPIEMIVQPKPSKVDLEKRKKAMEGFEKIRASVKMTKAEVDELLAICKKEREDRDKRLYKLAIS